MDLTRVEIGRLINSLCEMEGFNSYWLAPNGFAYSCGNHLEFARNWARSHHWRVSDDSELAMMAMMKRQGWCRVIIVDHERTIYATFGQLTSDQLHELSGMANQRGYVVKDNHGRIINVDSVQAEARLSMDDKEDLAYLIHDKTHISGSEGDRIPGLDKALKIFSSPCPRVWRGLIKDPVMEVGQSFWAKGYSSFSESIEVAKRFADRTKKLLSMEGVPGFCYWRWSVADLKKLKRQDPVEYDMSDGDGLIESHEEEQEWIFGPGTYTVIGLEEVDGHEVYTVMLVQD